MPDSNVPESTSEAAEIRLEDLTKTYEGTTEPAVESVNMTIPAGEIVILVGPSGCGKTTTMRMINRLIQPTSGRIFLDDEDITNTDVNKLRRRMGYTIQRIGLFPHQTIYENVAVVPGLLNWDESRTKERVDELMDLVGLDPKKFSDRYPKELSGGQQQRVGVARAMAADPPVMLMDEPFGATDPITRERLQNEFLRIQTQIRKTIVFVTHDIDEAIKMGDRIAILSEQSHIEQYDTPENILSNPANDFVSDFVGSGASLKRLNLTRVREVEITDITTATTNDAPEELRRRLDEADGTSLLLLDDNHRPSRWVTEKDLQGVEKGGRDLSEVGLPANALIQPQGTLADALDEMLTSNGGVAIVVDGDGVYQGIVDMETAVLTIRRLRDTSESELRSIKSQTAGA